MYDLKGNDISSLSYVTTFKCLAFRILFNPVDYNGSMI
jgi:hypothetical protein